MLALLAWLPCRISGDECVYSSLSLSQYLLSLMQAKVSPSTSMSPTTRIHLLEAVVMLKSSLGVCTSPQSTSGSSLLDLHWCLSAIPSVMWCPMQFSQRFLDQHLKWVTPPIAHSYAERHCLPFSNPHTYIPTVSWGHILPSFLLRAPTISTFSSSLLFSHFGSCSGSYFYPSLLHPTAV